MQTTQEMASGKVKRAVPILSIFGCKILLRSGLLTILTASIVGIFFVLGSSYASSAPLDSGIKTFGHAHENRFVEPYQKQTDATEISKEVREIRVEFAPEGEEKVLFLLNGFYPPKYLVLEGDRPRIACDFYGARLGKDIGRCIKVNGRLVQQIRTAVYRGKNPKIKVVLDLVPGKNYEVEQIFYKKDNRYVIAVKEERADH
ncbi:MAG: hypothetical protein J7M30_17620 [Deltaproteobacteria bacterium]|nr:hypothetical protein [Deltaproteobacteria bacterium]